MPTETMNISLPSELKASIEKRVRLGLYGNASDVIRAGLRALAREELGASIARFEQIIAALPEDPITEQIEQEIDSDLRRDHGKRRVQRRK